MNLMPDSKVEQCYASWLEQFDIGYVHKWRHLLSNDHEAAICEARFWEVLQNTGAKVEPNEDLAGQRRFPDFRCLKNGEKFYVEVTCITTSQATRRTSLPHLPDNKVQSYANLNRSVFAKAVSKAKQCANLDAPALVAVGTFHFQASQLCVTKWEIEQLLTGNQLIAHLINTQSGDPVGDTFLSTKFQLATFLRAWLQPARRSVSGLLLGGLGCRPPNLFGVLHPEPVRPFNRTLLRDIEFCRLRQDCDEKTLEVEWV